MTTSFHHPKSFAQVTRVVSLGHFFHTTPHGLRGVVVSDAPFGDQGAEARTVLHVTPRDAFTQDLFSRVIRQELETHYPENKPRQSHHVAYYVSIKGRALGYITRSREVHMSPDVLATATPAEKRAYDAVEGALQALAASAQSYHFKLDRI